MLLPESVIRSAFCFPTTATNEAVDPLPLSSFFYFLGEPLEAILGPPSSSFLTPFVDTLPASPHPSAGGSAVQSLAQAFRPEFDLA